MAIRRPRFNVVALGILIAALAGGVAWTVSGPAWPTGDHQPGDRLWHEEMRSNSFFQAVGLTGACSTWRRGPKPARSSGPGRGLPPGV
jgi:hypothetical protein